MVAYGRVGRGQRTTRDKMHEPARNYVAVAKQVVEVAIVPQRAGRGWCPLFGLLSPASNKTSTSTFTSPVSPDDPNKASG